MPRTNSSTHSSYLDISNIYRRPVAVDLFAGAGGFSLGIEQAGFDVLVAVEYDPVHACTYSFNFPLTEVLYANASTLTSQMIKEAATRSWSFHHPHSGRLVTELSPRYFVMENVPGMLVGKHQTLLQQLKSQFKAAGYLAREEILNAADFGVPQKRNRLFLIGFQSGGSPPDFPTPTIKRVAVGDAIADLPDLDNFPELLKTDEQLKNFV